MGTALLLVRTGDGDIRCFHNVCRHRGVRLVERRESGRKAVRCPYHSWTYDLEGRLRATPHIGGVDRHSAPGFRKRERSLFPGAHGRVAGHGVRRSLRRRAGAGGVA